MTIQLSVEESVGGCEETGAKLGDPLDHVEKISVVAGAKLAYINTDRPNEHAEPVGAGNDGQCRRA